MILIHAYASALRTGLPNPKTYPYWVELLTLLAEPNVIQIGVTGDTPLVKDFRALLPLKEIRKLVEHCKYWIAIDSFLPHLAHHVPKPGVTLWSVSDPSRFGYPENLNLLRDPKYLRPKQYRIWEEQSYDPEAFLSAYDVAARICAWRSS